MIIEDLRRRIEVKDTFEEILEVIYNDLFIIKDELYIFKDLQVGNYANKQRKLDNPIRATFNSISSKIIMRNSREVNGGYYREDSIESLIGEALVLFLEFFKKSYEGNVKLNGIELLSTDKLGKFKECFNERNISKFMSIAYNHCINKDFDTSTKNNTYNSFNVYTKKTIEGKQTTVWNNLEINVSFDAEVEDSDGNDMNMEDYLYSKSENLRELISNEEELNKNSSNVIKILLANIDTLTSKQQLFLKHMAQLIELKNINIWSNDIQYSNESKHQYKKFIVASYVKSIEKGEIPTLEVYKIKNKKYIKQIRNNQIDEFFNEIVKFKYTDEQFAYLDSVLNKDSKLSENITELMLDCNIYDKYMQVKRNELSVNKFMVIYFNKIIKERI